MKVLLAELTQVDDWMIAGFLGVRQRFEKYVRWRASSWRSKPWTKPQEGELLRHAKHYFNR